MSSDGAEPPPPANVGIIFQSFNLISTMSAAENVALAMMFAGVPRARARRPAPRLLESVGLGGRQRHRPSGAVGRRAAARRDRARAGERAAPAPRRRADGQPRQPDVARASWRCSRSSTSATARPIIMVTHDASARRELRAPCDHDARRRGGGGMTPRDAADTVSLALREPRTGEAAHVADDARRRRSASRRSREWSSLGVGLQDQFVGRFTQVRACSTRSRCSPGARSAGIFAAGAVGTRRRHWPRGRAPVQRAAAVPTTPRDARRRRARGARGAAGRRGAAYPNIRADRCEVSSRLVASSRTVAGVPMAARGEGAFQIDSPRDASSRQRPKTPCMLSLDYAKRIDEQNARQPDRPADADASTPRRRAAPSAYAGAPARPVSMARAMQRATRHVPDRRHRRARDRSAVGAARRRRG